MSIGISTISVDLATTGAQSYNLRGSCWKSALHSWLPFGRQALQFLRCSAGEEMQCWFWLQQLYCPFAESYCCGFSSLQKVRSRAFFTLHPTHMQGKAFFPGILVAVSLDDSSLFIIAFPSDYHYALWSVPRTHP